MQINYVYVLIDHCSKTRISFQNALPRADSIQHTFQNYLMWFSTRHSNVIGDLYHAETVLDKITSRSGFTHFERFQNTLISGHVDSLDLFEDIRRISCREGGQEQSASCPQKTKTSSPDPCARDEEERKLTRSVKPGPEMNHLRQLVTFSKRSECFDESRRWIGFWLASAKSVEEYRNRNASQPCQRYPETIPAGH